MSEERPTKWRSPWHREKATKSRQTVANVIALVFIILLIGMLVSVLGGMTYG